MVNTVWVKVVTSILSPISPDEIREFSAFPFSIHLMFDQTLSNLIVCLMMSYKIHTTVAQMS